MYTTFEDSSSWYDVKEKLTNKGNDKQWAAVFLIHSTTNHYQALYQIYNHESSSSREICDGNFPMHYVEEREMDKQK